MTYIRRLIRGDNVHLYDVTGYRDKEMGKLRQKSVHKGKEIIKNDTVTVLNPGTGLIPVRCLIQLHT